jgi:hypothetical protein
MSTRDPGLGPAHARQAVSGDGVDMHLPALLNVVRRWRMAVAGGQSGGQRPSPPACARPSVTGRHGGAISKPAQDPDAPTTTALTCMRPRREQPHQRAVADAGAAVQLAFDVARRRRCISGGHTTVECQPTMQADPHTPCPLRHTMRAPGSRPVARLVWTRRERPAAAPASRLLSTRGRRDASRGSRLGVRSCTDPPQGPSAEHGERHEPADEVVPGGPRLGLEVGVVDHVHRDHADREQEQQGLALDGAGASPERGSTSIGGARAVGCHGR